LVFWPDTGARVIGAAGAGRDTGAVGAGRETVVVVVVTAPLQTALLALPALEQS
jgi:hypothetical protein